MMRVNDERKDQAASERGSGCAKDLRQREPRTAWSFGNRSCGERRVGLLDEEDDPPAVGAISHVRDGGKALMFRQGILGERAELIG
jgi:hypothetical protein